MRYDLNEESIIVKHIPTIFSLRDCEEFFSFFNCKSVTYFNKTGPMQHTAIVKFRCYDDAYKAIFSLHERQILNSRLCVQFLKVKTNIQWDSGETTNEGGIYKSKNCNTHTANVIPDWITSLLSIAPTWGLNGPIPPKLKYNYPKPNNIILTNIVRALIANENFYTQTLHLMNKFHFPAPFTTDVNFPGNVSVANKEDIENNKPSKKSKHKTIESIEMDISSGNESEISDGEHPPTAKRQKLSFPKIQTNSLSTNYEFKSNSVKNIALNEIFENKESKPESHIEFRPISSIAEINDKSAEDSAYAFVEGFGKIDNAVPSENHVDEPTFVRSSVVIDEITESVHKNFKLRKDKIPKNVANSNATEKVIGDRIEKPTTILSLEEIKANILSKTDWQSVNALKNYQRGLPSNQLYVKNISKKVSKDDIISLYAGFVDWSNESEVTSFQVTYFTEGRMKGQAFVCFGSQSAAENALESTNAYNFVDKPIAVQFSKNITNS